MRFPNPFKPWFVYRPRQLVRRVVRALRPPSDPIQVVELPWGCPIEIDTRESIGRSVWTAGVHDLAVVEVLFRLADPRLLAIDVGANIGLMTSALALRAVEVWAFEPHPEVFQRMAANIERFARRSGFAPCRQFQIALSDNDVEVHLETPNCFSTNQGTARVTSGSGVAVRAAQLDTLLGSRDVGVMKVDVEGHELSVFHGAERSLSTGRIRHIVFEDHAGPDSPVCGLLASHGYILFEVAWSMRGPVLGAPGSGSHRAYEAASFLATRDAEVAVARCRQRGWQCFRPGVRARDQ